MRRSLLHFILLSAVPVYLFSGSHLFAQGMDADQITSAIGGDQPEASAQETASDRMDSIMADSVRSMFQEKEMPLLHIRWGTKVYVDIPAGNEPADATPVLRKAELRLSRKLGRNFQLKLSGNYQAGEFQAGDSYLVYSGWKAAILTTGVQSPPFSLQSSTTSSATTFMEGALPVNALSENKNAGVDFLRRTTNHLLNASWVFYNPRQEGVSERGQALVARYVYSPINFHGRKNHHIGGSISYRFLDDDADVQLRSRPEVATTDFFYVDTGNIEDGKSIARIGLESSRVNGRFSWQYEVLGSRVHRNNAETLNFWGAYAQVSQFLTSDSRNYDQGSGTFINVIPGAPVGGDGWGAFEVALRASYVDLTDKDIIGGRESNVSLGLNWYLNKNLRVMGNVIKVLDVDRPGSEFDGENPLIFALRAQWLIY